MIWTCRALSRTHPSSSRAFSIRVVVSLHPGPAWLDEPGSDIRRYERFVEDGDDLPGSADETAVVAVAQLALAVGDSVLIHCHGGLNRSAYCAGRLMVDAGMAPEAAVRSLLRARGPETLVNRIFAAALLGRPIPEEWRRRV